METTEQVGLAGPRYGLGNFLSGMETRDGPVDVAGLCALETSLVEWKPPTNRPVGRVSVSLETSLVEWKHTSSGKNAWMKVLLGNFLSGMETGFRFLIFNSVKAPWKLP